MMRWLGRSGWRGESGWSSTSPGTLWRSGWRRLWRKPVAPGTRRRRSSLPAERSAVHAEQPRRHDFPVVSRCEVACSVTELDARVVVREDVEQRLGEGPWFGL